MGCAQWVHPNRHEVGPIQRLDEYRTLLQTGKPAAVPHSRPRALEHPMQRTEVDHHLDIAIRQHRFAKRAESAAHFPVLVNYVRKRRGRLRSHEGPSAELRSMRELVDFHAVPFASAFEMMFCASVCIL